MFRSILITGATGLIGSALCDALAGCVRVYPCARSASGGSWIAYDATKPLTIDFPVDVVVHAASPASPDLFIRNPVETLMANINGVQQILEYGRKFNVKKIVYISSSEVYGSAKPREDGYIETDGGVIDVHNLRSSYPIAKLASESLCLAYAAQYGVNVCIVRPGHVYGPTCLEKDARVSSSFPWRAARGLPVELKSDGMQLRSYTHVDDCVKAILTLIEKGLAGEVYNIASRCGRCTIRQMAEIVARAGGVELVTCHSNERQDVVINPMNNSCLDPSKLESLGWSGVIDPLVGFTQTVEKLKARIS